MEQTTHRSTFAEFLTVAEAAEFLGVSPWTLRNWDNAGKLKPIRHPLSGYRLYRQKELEVLLEAGVPAGKRNGTLGPKMDWSGIGAAEHFVQFYETDEYLVDSVCAYASTAIAADEAVLIIATPQHRAGIQRKLKAQGVDLAVVGERGQYAALDAAETLSKFMVGALPDLARFEEVVGEVIGRLARQRRVRAFGEMVAVLWETGNREAACRLEHLWNDLARRHSFALFCAYPLSGFSGETDGAPLTDICAYHARVLPAESYSRLCTPVEQLRGIAQLQQRAQALEGAMAKRAQLERELSDFLENALEGLHKVGPDGSILWANQAELDLLGYRPEDYVGHHISEFHIDADIIEDMRRRLMSGENILNQPARLRCKDGSIKQVLIHANAYMEDGRFIYSRCFTRDMTESQAAERDRSLLAAIVDSSDDAIISKTLDGTITSWNAGAQRIFGYTADEVIGRSIMLIIPPERHSEEHDILARLRRGERVEHYETVRVAKDGRLLDVSLTVSPVRNSAGKIIGASKVGRDITARKQAQRALRESEQRFARFMQYLPGLAWIKDARGRYVFANDAAAKLFGIGRSELMGKEDEALFPPETAAQFKESDQRALESNTGIQVIESLKQADGVHYFVISKFPIPGPDSTAAFVGGVAIDITDRMRAEEALKQADRCKDEFLATLAHELRNPLAPIRNGLHILRTNGDSVAAAGELHDMMERQVAHMVRLVDDLLELSRISRGHIELKKERVELETIIKHALESSMPLIEGNGHQLRVCLPTEPIVVQGDLVRLAQVFSNLLNNAAKYTDRGGEITVSARREGGDVLVAVRDTGIGIPRDMLDRVFEMFARVDNELRRTQDGLGIGLHLVRTLVSMHGGGVVAHSEGLGRGSELVVRLPVAEAGRCHSTDFQGNGRKPAGLSAQRILIVDDYRDSADTLARLLKFQGCDVHAAYDGHSALEVIRICRPSVVLLDLGMPDLSGYEVARRLRQDPQTRDIHLIALTGWAQEKDRRWSREAGFDHHLVKPVDLAELEDLLGSLGTRQVPAAAAVAPAT